MMTLNGDISHHLPSSFTATLAIIITLYVRWRRERISGSQVLDHQFEANKVLTENLSVVKLNLNSPIIIFTMNYHMMTEDPLMGEMHFIL